MPTVGVESGAGELAIVVGTADPGERWDAYIASQPAGHLMQSRAWAGVRQATGWQPLFLRLERDGALCAAALLLRRRIPGTGLCLLYAPRGPVLDWNDPAVVDALGVALRQVARDQRAFLVQADPAVPQERGDAHAALARMGFRREEKHGIFRILQPRWVMRIPLDRYGGPEGLLAALPHKMRYKIRLAERRGVVVVPRTDHEAARAFHRLLWAAGRRKRFPVRGFRYHEAIWRHCVQAGLGEYLFAEQAEQLLAAIQVLRFGPTSWYMYGASAADDEKLRASYQLQWSGITRAWATGCRCYDMGGVHSPTPKPEDRDYGLYDFKQRFNAEMVTFLGEYDLVIRPRTYLVWRRLEHAVQRPAGWAYRLWQRLTGSA